MSRTLLSILAGLGGMLGWGVSDFFANTTSERIGHTKTLFWSQIAGLLLVVFLTLLIPISLSTSPLLLTLSVVAGIGYAVGYLLFYKGFEIGNVSVVSAVVNLQTIFVMLIAYFLFEQTLSIIQIPAIFLVILGILLVSVNFKELTAGTVSLLAGVKETLISTILFGVIYWPLQEFIVEQTSWILTIIIIKVVALATISLIAGWQKESLLVTKVSRKQIFVLSLIGILEALAVVSVALGLTYGDSIIVAPISSALTLVTVGLAMMFLNEKLTRIQLVGILITISGIILSAF